VRRTLVGGFELRIALELAGAELDGGEGEGEIAAVGPRAWAALVPRFITI